MSQEGTKTKYLLSIDGGGVRAVASVLFLKRLEEALSMPLYEKFDFFVGTSAGAIIAMGDIFSQSQSPFRLHSNVVQWYSCYPVVC